MAVIKYLLALALFGAFSSASEVVPKGFSVLKSPDGIHNSYFFIISPLAVDWYTARQICESIGPYRYVSLESRDKSAELYLKLSSENVREAWTSGNDVIANGRYVWAALDDRPFGEFQGWRRGGPSPPNNPDCHCVSVTALAGECGSQCIGEWGWDEEQCSNAKRVVCEPITQQP